jgi:hypothetical protein
MHINLSSFDSKGAKWPRNQHARESEQMSSSDFVKHPGAWHLWGQLEVVDCTGSPIRALALVSKG